MYIFLTRTERCAEDETLRRKKMFVKWEKICIQDANCHSKKCDYNVSNWGLRIHLAVPYFDMKTKVKDF